MTAQAIGGYFELENIADAKDNGALKFSSARTALSALLIGNGFNKAAIPRFLCGSVKDELQRVGITVREYDLESDLSPCADLHPAFDEAVLLVNYFGIARDRVDAALARLPREQCAIDNSQAFFEPSADCLGTIYSPRKFFGLPDGGLLYTKSDVQTPEAEDPHSVERCAHLLHRLGSSPEDGLVEFRAAEASLDGEAQYRMSTLTARLLASIDTERARNRRNGNFDTVHSLLGEWNRLHLSNKCRGPLTYPLQLEREQAVEVRKALIANRIFSPIYWGERMTAQHADNENAAGHLSASIVHIPIDHRYHAELITNHLRSVPVLADLLRGTHDSNQ